ncbi:MAG: hypothetical protein ACOY5B_03685 [Spirochaetota bacterium]
MNKLHITIWLTGLAATSCASNSIYYRAIENTGNEFTFYEGIETELIHITKALVELQRDSAMLTVFTSMKGAVHRIISEKCQVETRAYNFGTRVFMYHCPTGRMYRSGSEIYVQIDRKGLEPFESRGSTQIKLMPVDQRKFEHRMQTLEDKVKHTLTWFNKEPQFQIEAWHFDKKYAKYRNEIQAELTKLKKKHNYSPTSPGVTTDKLLQIEHDISLEIHGYCIETYP